MGMEALEGLANGPAAVLHVVPPSAGPLANRATVVEILVQVNHSHGMKAGKGAHQGRQRRPQGVPVPPSTPFSRSNGGNPGQDKLRFPRSCARTALG